MKVQFTKLVQFVPSWNGNTELPPEEQVVAMLTPLSTDNLIRLMDVLQKTSGGKIDPESLVKDGAKTRDISDIKSMVTSAADMIPTNVELKGLIDADGEAVTADMITNFPFFLELAAEIVAELAAISMPNEVEEKN